ncbi:hypothetical protein MUU48_13470 [Scandinavium sp. H11S7]|uniref:Uncharacterized protein n=1 Tax=Scandinavium hiltneri TaxID=2926519 RepID=A0ABT2E7D1_9ENTR|nr:hypothetical protein [Scandinavium hiltneri]MCS2157914.1 hypothetical protein [Scandinavium hiltneri]MCS2163803.1 hypothetical protein [Scandinavium hiltneri]
MAAANTYEVKQSACQKLKPEVIQRILAFSVAAASSAVRLNENERQEGKTKRTIAVQGAFCFCTSARWCK